MRSSRLPLTDVDTIMTVFADKRPIWQGMQDVRAPIHRFQMVSWGKNAVQEDGSLSELCEDEKRLPDLSS